jgi:uncharacterized membrane protein YuzA (DUF378 family)
VSHVNLGSLTQILIIIGGLNWLLEVFGFGIGRFLPSAITTLVYVLVGLSALYQAFKFGK